MFVDLSEKRAVVIGGGKIAARRVHTLLDFAGEIFVVAPEADETLVKLAEDGLITYARRPYEPGDLDGADLVLAATDNISLNDEIYAECKRRKITVNVASDKEKCDFHFPGIVKKDSMVIGVNAGGNDHRGAKEMRQKLQRYLDNEPLEGTAYMEKKVITIGSRESKLAVIQSEMVREFIEKNNPGCEVNILTMKTTGDIILDRTLDEVGGKGLFVKELDKALIDGRSDLSVHSMKDLPMEVPAELPIIACSKREDPRDVLILPKGETEYRGDKPIGSSSARRTLKLAKIFPGAEFKSVRGNVITRLRKLDEGEYGALVLAAAGVKRLGLEDRISRYFEPDEVIPAACQGILAVQGREGEDYSYLDGYRDESSALAAAAERAFVSYLDGGCSSPVAAYAEVDGDKIVLRGLYYDEATGKHCVGVKEGAAADAKAVGEALAEELKNKMRGE